MDNTNIKEKITVTVGYIDFEFSSINLAIDFARTAVNSIDREEAYKKVTLNVTYEDTTENEEEE